MVKLAHKNRMGSDMAVTPSKFSLQSAWSYAAEHPKKAVAVAIALTALSVFVFYLTKPSTPVIPKDPLEGVTTPEKLYAVLEKHPELVNRKIDWTFPNSSTLFEANQENTWPRWVKGVYIAHLLCAGSLANAEATYQLLEIVLPHMDLTLIDESRLYSYLSACSKNNVLQTAIAAASPFPSGSVTRRNAVDLILRHMEAEEFPQEKRTTILYATDNYPGNKHTAAELLMRQGNDDFVLRVVKMGARITPRLLIFAAFSMGTTEWGTMLIEELLKRFNGTLTAEEHGNLKEGLIAYSLINRTMTLGFYETKFPNLETVQANYFQWVIEAIQRIRKSRNLQETTIEKDKAKIQQAMTDLRIDWADVKKMIIHQKVIESFQPNCLAYGYFSNEFRETEKSPKDRRIAFMQDEANVEKVKTLLPLADKIQIV
jgi:hypothetical protein